MSYATSKSYYASLGVDTDAAIIKALSLPLSLHCWQGDDVCGFDNAGALSGGIQTTGNYPGRARTPEELMSQLDCAFSFIPGPHRLNLHANYAIFGEGEHVDRDKISPKHFTKWVKFAREKEIVGIDFNPTFFGHKMAASGLTLSSPDENVRRFWIEHGKRCVEIAQYFADELNTHCLLNIWIPDGYKNTPTDRKGPRARFAASLDEITAAPHDPKKVLISLESKVFGIGVESYTVGSAEFCAAYATKNNLVPLFDNGHYHPTESVADKISSALLFSDKLALHLTRGVRWDSDHVPVWGDEILEIAREVVRNGPDKVLLATDYFDASINRVAAWITGGRTVRKALLAAMLEPAETLRELQDKGDFTALLVLKEELATAPFYDVWTEYLRRAGVADEYLAVLREGGIGEK